MKKLFVVLLVLVTSCFFKKEVHIYPDSVFNLGYATGKVDGRLAEASGMVASKANPGLLWTHNDSGNPAEIFLIDTLAQIKMVCLLKGVENRDWEDIAIGPGPDSTKTYLYIGDIGDNMAQYPVKRIYRLEEPVLSTGNAEITVFDSLRVKLEDGIRDSEAFTIDPLSKDLLLFSKREDSIHMYTIPFPYEGDTIEAAYRLTLPYHNINAVDVSADGQEVLMKDYNNIYYWRKNGNEPLIDLLRTPAQGVSYQVEVQGESITFSRDRKGFFTLSESSPTGFADLVFYKRK
jgi:hypothetical protein